LAVELDRLAGLSTRGDSAPLGIVHLTPSELGMFAQLVVPVITEI
jgi:hypothetical protein